MPTPPIETTVIDAPFSSGEDEAKARVTLRLEQWHANLETEGDLTLEIARVGKDNAATPIGRKIFSLSDHPATLADTLVDLAFEDVQTRGSGRYVYRVAVSENEKLGIASFTLTYGSGEAEEQTSWAGGDLEERTILARSLTHMERREKEIRIREQAIFDRLTEEATRAQIEVRETRRALNGHYEAMGRLLRADREQDRLDRKEKRNEEMMEGLFKTVMPLAPSVVSYFAPSLAPAIAKMGQASQQQPSAPSSSPPPATSSAPEPAPAPPPGEERPGKTLVVLIATAPPEVKQLMMQKATEGALVLPDPMWQLALAALREHLARRMQKQGPPIGMGAEEMLVEGVLQALSDEEIMSAAATLGVMGLMPITPAMRVPLMLLLKKVSEATVKEG